MTPEQFTAEIMKLEAAKCVPIPRNKEELNYRDMRRAAIWDLVGGLDAEVLCEARKRLCMPSGERGSKFFPSVDEIVQACDDVAEELAGEKAPELRKSKFHPVEHECSKEKPKECVALTWLATFRYEADHILCRGKIPATCPQCGSRHYVPNAHRPLVEMFPSEETKDWNLCFKGLLWCSKCTPKADNG